VDAKTVMEEPAETGGNGGVCIVATFDGPSASYRSNERKRVQLRGEISSAGERFPRIGRHVLPSPIPLPAMSIRLSFHHPPHSHQQTTSSQTRPWSSDPSS
jgi:hypothetical protein